AQDASANRRAGAWAVGARARRHPDPRDRSGADLPVASVADADRDGDCSGRRRGTAGDRPRAWPGPRVAWGTTPAPRHHVRRRSPSDRVLKERASLAETRAGTRT